MGNINWAELPMTIIKWQINRFWQLLSDLWMIITRFDEMFKFTPISLFLIPASYTVKILPLPLTYLLWTMKKARDKIKFNKNKNSFIKKIDKKIELGQKIDITEEQFGHLPQTTKDKLKNLNKTGGKNFLLDMFSTRPDIFEFVMTVGLIMLIFYWEQVPKCSKHLEDKMKNLKKDVTELEKEVAKMQEKSGDDKKKDDKKKDNKKKDDKEKDDKEPKEQAMTLEEEDEDGEENKNKNKDDKKKNDFDWDTCRKKQNHSRKYCEKKQKEAKKENFSTKENFSSKDLQKKEENLKKKSKELKDLEDNWLSFDLTKILWDGFMHTITPMGMYIGYWYGFQYIPYVGIFFKIITKIPVISNLFGGLFIYFFYNIMRNLRDITKRNSCFDKKQKQ